MSITAIEVLLAVLAIILGVGAFAGFWMLKGSAQEAARVEAREYLKVHGAALFAQIDQTRDGESDALIAAVTSEGIDEKTGGE